MSTFLAVLVASCTASGHVQSPGGPGPSVAVAPSVASVPPPAPAVFVGPFPSQGPRTADTYRGGIDRSGVMPGPAPVAPVKLRWAFQAGAPLRSAVAVADGVAYVGTEAGTLYAIQLSSGKKVWQTQVADGPLGSPSVDGGLVVVGGPDAVYALATRGGTLRWKAEADGPVDGGTTVDHGAVLVGTEAGTVVALGEATGTSLWTATGLGGPITRTMAVSGSLLFAGVDGDGTVVALDLATGGVVWRHATAASGSVCTITVVEAVVFACTGLDDAATDSHHIVALAAATGDLRWTDTRDSGATLYPPVVTGGHAYVVGDDRQVQALDTTSGAVTWTFTTTGIDEVTPAWADGQLFVADDANTLYAIDGTTGTELWQTKFAGQAYAPTVVDGLVLVPTNVGLLQAFGSAG